MRQVIRRFLKHLEAEKNASVTTSFILNSHRTQLAELAVKNRLPVMYNRPEYVEAGGLLTYGVKPHRLGPARRYVRRQDPERR